MRITLNGSALKELVTNMGKVVPRSCNLPVLGHLLVEPAADGTAAITADSLEERLTFRIPADCVTAGAGQPFLVPFDALKAAAKGAGKRATVTIGTGSDLTVTITTEIDGTSVPRTVGTLSAEDFPAAVSDVPMTECDPEQVVNAIRALAPFVTREASRQTLAGVFADPEARRMVATDGRRLTALSFEPFPFEQGIIIPPTRVLTSGILTGDAGHIGVSETDIRTVLAISAGSWCYTVRCTEGTYPNYRQVIPDIAGAVARVRFDPAEVPMMLTVIRQFIRGDAQSVVLFARGDRVALLSATGNPEAPYTCIDLPKASSDSAEPLVQHFNPKYLLEALQAGFTELHATGPSSPVLLTGIEGGLHALMPLASCDVEGVIHAMNGTAAEAVPPEEKEQPMPAESTKAKATSAATEAQPGSGLEIIPQPDPLTAFIGQIADAQGKIRAAEETVRGLKRAARDLERSIRAREKEISAREKEFERSAKLITRLQEAIAA